ncbi:p-loop containing nucleoside triphosphate hydrolase [Venustampulla echinocandica]|uniref:p-loop containing nucleoside triphosphate hydrolase n=1 Tax=Venustampulla echinocandica TaxID=2656787 RepID=A0A370TXV4_9HELO|nr:p-loop containing nucleoside triphosphate hydrolase [Venustampulla echinocandica]RDL40340.1 p-loop containing nucleoside triphosphate hydrolase [Venustampulla echinocandica]
MSETPDQEPSAASRSILSWYDSTRPMIIDLIGDYAGKELFLLEGDSLLRECFEDDRIDFDSGFQLLHSVPLENAALCVPPGLPPTHRARYLLARAVIKRHFALRLPSSHPDVAINVFPSLESQEFKEYLDVTPIHFVMMHDGSSRSKKIKRDSSDDDEKLAKILLRGMIWWWNTHRLNVSLINRIEFRDSKVFTMIVESFTPSSKQAFLISSAAIQDEIKHATESMKELQSEQSSGEQAASANFQRLVKCPPGDIDSESYYLAAYGVSAILKCQDCDIFMASAFILHTIILKHVPISQRRLPLISFDEEFEDQIEGFIEDISNICRQTIDSAEWTELMAERMAQSDTTDLVDGRVFRAVIQAMCDKSIEDDLPSSVKSDWKLLHQLVKQLTGEELSLKGSTEPEFSESTATESDLKPTPEDLSVLPFSHPVFDKHLECIHVATDTSISTKMEAMKLYRETSHWHNHRKPLNPKVPQAVKVSKWRNPLRLNQFYMSEMTSYAASLTGAKGRALDAETITVGPKRLVKPAEKAEKAEKSSAIAKQQQALDKGAQGQKAAPKKGTKKAAAGLSKKDQMIADNMERKGGSEADKAFNAWATIRKNFDVLSNDQDRYLRTIDYLNGLDSTKTTYLEGEVNTYALQSLLGWWAEYCKSGNKSGGYHVVALIWTTIRTICSITSPVSKEIVQHVTKICTLLGITDAATPFASSTTDRKLSFTFKYPVQAPSLLIDMTQSEFQLNHCGPYMDRMLDAKPDPRVSSFVPDGWQRDVLDQLDANKSVFVVAPTSAGKTFISFYAMEQVLRADNDGVLIYVAPTKALVNQIAAEVQGRFSKKYPLPGKGVWAIHTRDYRVNNPTGCQILVTVPHILQIMLLSPSNAKSWAPRVRRIIFDEIHSIGQAEDGVVWEQLLLLAPCPIIALSATVGNPGQFNDWLIETQKATGTELKMIQHATRYSDLRKYMYEPPKSFRFTGLGRSHGVGLGLDGLTGFEEFHPVASLVDKSRGMPDDLALEPRDCLSLWKAMCKCQTENYKVPESLNPAKALPPCIRKADIFAWEKGLKKVLLQWMQDSASPFDKVILELSPSAPREQLEEAPSSASSVTEGEDLDPQDLEATTLPLLYKLHTRRALPAILFNYDRAQCETIAFAVLRQLVEAEDRWKQGPQWKKLMEGYERYKEQKEKKSRKPAKPSKKSKDDDEGGSKLDRMRDEASDGSSIYDLFDPDAPQTDFSFADPKRLQKAELDEFIRALRWKNIKDELIDLLRRGIGVHHAGMNRKYRQCVEMLFRKGFLRVVIATGTLSLGINMPCSTVVFSGDSVYLTALNFRQAAGRSGRRGFDLLGNVVFQGISKERASRLLSSKLPELTGHFPITTTLVLRLFTLLNGSNTSPYAVKAINSLLSQPRLYLGGDSFKEQVLHHLRFSIEYLRRNELLSPRGEPVNFTSCVSHLYFTENSSFAFHALLRGGYFHQLCADIDTQPDTILQKMILVLSHLFGRRVCREIDDPEEAEKIKASPSIVYLPPMPEEATEILRRHNKDTLDIFTTYAKTFAEQHAKGEEQRLPLTHTEVGPEEPSTANFLPSLPTPHARSAFVALSGLGDDFVTIEDLCSSTRDGVFLESAVVPHLEIHPDETRTPLNAYLVDFYMHGALEPLERANGIRKSDVWFVLNDFSLVLATIATSLALYLGLESDADPEMLDVMGSGDIAENDADEAVAEQTVQDTQPKIGTPVQAPPPVRRKKKVAEDWDASEDAMVAEENFLKSGGLNGTGATDDEEYDKLMNVYKAFRKLKTDFDEKFRAIWA